MIDCPQYYPVPVTGLAPSTIYQSLKGSLESDGIKGTLTIQAYVDNNEFSDEIQVIFSNAGIETYSITGGDESKYHLMIRNVLHWILKHPPPANVILLSKETHHLLRVFDDLDERGYNVLVSDTDSGYDVPVGSPDWIQDSLVDHDGSLPGHVDKKLKRLANSGETTMCRQPSDIFSLETIFLKDASTKFSEGYYCDPSLMAYLDQNSLETDLVQEWRDRCFACGLITRLIAKAKGDTAGPYSMFTDIMYFALNCRYPWNVVVISDTLRSDSIYARILQDLKSKNVNVGFARTAMLNLDGGGGLSQEQELKLIWRN
ncbi:unnamed protein product [Arabis nemorensis]|uniref:NYN domain-containing protein n=1 Tax=Arabis nemorensis TaxID=586526 RepID=A0A565CU08_9BRAS|nr:unnamed protein product [Arabis nemorensis]